MMANTSENVSFYFPPFNRPSLRREVATYLVYGSIIRCILPRIPHSLDLVERIKCRAITFEFEDIDKLRCLHNTIYPALALLLLDINRKTTYHSQDEIEGVLEITLLLSLVIFTTLAIRDAGKERSEQFLQLLAITSIYGIHHL